MTTRIRASFDGKRSKSEVTTPTTNGFSSSTQDPDTLRQAIDQAINAEAFQNAIAANLAKLLKPTIKSALDTIQPVVEAVYNHEVLLRKTNQSVENILERLDTVNEAPNEEDDGEPLGDSLNSAIRKKASSTSNNYEDVEGVKHLFAENQARNDAKLAELSNLLEADSSKIAGIVESIAGINAALWPTREALDSLKSFSEHSNTTTSVMQAQLDQLNADVGTIIDSIGSDLGSQVKSIKQQVAAPDTSLLSAYNMKLDTISTDVGGLRDRADTSQILKDISINLEVLKDNVQAGIATSNEHFAVLNPHISDILSSVEAQWSKLKEIHTEDAKAEVLAAIQKSNQSHAAHTVALSELKDRAIASVPKPPLASSSPETTALRALAADLASLKENIEAGLATNYENVSGIESKIDDVLATIEVHRAADPSADILAAVQKSNDSHASHAEALEGIKSISAVSASSSGASGIATLEPQIASIITTLDSHTTTLDNIKASGAVPVVAPVAEQSNLMEIDSNLTKILGTLGSHTSILNEIKDDIGAEILTVLHDVNEGHSSQNTILAEIREADMSDEILTALHASNDSHANHAIALANLQTAVNASNDSHASHSGALDEIKAAESTSAEDVRNNDEALNAQIGAIITSLEEQTTTLAALRDTTNASNESHAVHTSTLAQIRDGTAASNGSLTSHAAVLSDLKSEIASLIDSHAAHTSILAQIKDSTSSSSSFHDSHATKLDKLKEAVIGTSGSHASHSADLGELKDANKAANDLHALHITALTELKAAQTSMAAQIDINHTTVTTSINTLGDELKAEVDATGTDITSSVTSLGVDVKNIGLSPLNAAIEQYGKELRGVKASIEGLGVSVKGAGSDILGLEDGAHFNQRGLYQLKEHVTIHDLPDNTSLELADRSVHVDNSSASEPHEGIVSSLNKAHISNPEVAQETNIAEGEPLDHNDPVVDNEPVVESEPALPTSQASQEQEPKSGLKATNVELQNVENKAAATSDNLRHKTEALSTDEAPSTSDEHSSIPVESDPIEEVSGIPEDTAAEAVSAPFETQMVPTDDVSTDDVLTDDVLTDGIRTPVVPIQAEAAPIDVQNPVLEHPDVAKEEPLLGTEGHIRERSLSVEAAKSGHDEDTLFREPVHVEPARHEDITHNIPASVDELGSPSFEDQLSQNNAPALIDKSQTPPNIEEQKPTHEENDVLHGNEAAHHDKLAEAKVLEADDVAIDDKTLHLGDQLGGDAQIGGDAQATPKTQEEKTTSDESRDSPVKDDSVQLSDHDQLEGQEKPSKIQGTELASEVKKVIPVDEKSTNHDESAETENPEPPANTKHNEPSPAAESASSIVQAAKEPEVYSNHDEEMEEFSPLEEPRPSPASSPQTPEAELGTEGDQSRLDTGRASGSISASLSPPSPSFSGESYSSGKEGESEKKDEKDEKDN